MSRVTNLTHDRLLAALDYDPATGIFRWKIRPSNRIHVGDRAGVVATATGHRFITVDGDKLQATRLAWFFVHTEWPKGDIRLQDGNADNCAIVNLRDVSRIELARLRSTLSTNTSGYRGVSRHKNGRWQSSITANYKQINLGTFASPDEASTAYEHAAGLLSEAKTPAECERAADLIIQHRRKHVAWDRLVRDGRRTDWVDFDTFALDVGEMSSDEATIAAVDESSPIGKDNFRWLVRPVGDFDRTTKEGRAEYMRAYREANPERYRHSHLKANYDIDDVEFERMKKAQGGKCLICEEIPKQRLAVDHNHDTKAVRALLCKQCNWAMGQFKDNLFKLRGAVKYLERFEVNNVLPFEPTRTDRDWLHVATLGFGT